MTMPYCSCRTTQEVDGGGTALVEDVLAAIFTRLPAAAVVRCAATCRHWCRVVAKEAAVLSRAMPSQVTHGRRALLGLFHQEEGPGVAAARKRKRSSTSDDDGRPCFVPTAAGARLMHRGFPRMPAALPSLSRSRPVAARNGRVVLELGCERHADGLALCVLDPVTGHAALLPALAGADKPGFFACALLTGADLPHPSPSSFRVLIVYNRRTRTALRAYSSDTNRWSAEGALAGRIDPGRLRKLGQSVVVRGVAYWPLRRSVLAVRLDAAEPRELAMPPDGVLSDLPLERRLLGVTHRGELSFIDARLGYEDRALREEGLPSLSIILAIKVLRPAAAATDLHGDDEAQQWVRNGWVVVPRIKVRTCKDTVSLRWFCERSGVIFFTVGEDSSSPGAYAFNVTTEELEKLADCDSWRNVVGYEMDPAASLASIARY